MLGVFWMSVHKHMCMWSLTPSEVFKEELQSHDIQLLSCLARVSAL